MNPLETNIVTTTKAVLSQEQLKATIIAALGFPPNTTKVAFKAEEVDGSWVVSAEVTHEGVAPRTVWQPAEGTRMSPCGRGMTKC